MSTYKMLLEGKLVDGVALVDIINPATEEVITQAPVLNFRVDAQDVTPPQRRLMVELALAQACKFIESVIGGVPVWKKSGCATTIWKVGRLTRVSFAPRWNTTQHETGFDLDHTLCRRAPGRHS